MDKKIAKIIFRQDTASNMSNVILDLGEPAIAITEGNKGIIKIGDGHSRFADLPAISATHIIEEPSNDGEYLRKKAGDNYSWVHKDTQLDFKDLAALPYDIEIDMQYSYMDASGLPRPVYGIKKSFIVNVNANIADTRTIVDNSVYAILNCGGYAVAGDEGKISVNANSDKCKTSIFIDNSNALKITTQASCDRLDNIIDVWVLYSKI